MVETSAWRRRPPLRTASIILPITPPPELLAAPIRLGASVQLLGRHLLCMPPKSTFDAVSEPVSATPSQPMRVPEERIEHARVGEGQAQRGVGARVRRERAQRRSISTMVSSEYFTSQIV